MRLTTEFVILSTAGPKIFSKPAGYAQRTILVLTSNNNLTNPRRSDNKMSSSSAVPRRLSHIPRETKIPMQTPQDISDSNRLGPRASNVSNCSIGTSI